MRRPSRVPPPIPWVLSLLALAAACHPAVSRRAVAEGQRIYETKCVACHGVHGKGDGFVTFTPPVADLTSDRVQNKLDVELFDSIHQGRPNTAMGSWHVALSEEDVTAVVDYVRQLGRQP